MNISEIKPQYLSANPAIPGFDAATLGAHCYMTATFGANWQYDKSVPPDMWGRVLKVAQYKVLLSKPIVGNAFDDGALHDALHEVVMDESTPVELRADAVRKIDQIVGGTSVELNDEELVAEYMAELEDRLDG